MAKTKKNVKDNKDILTNASFPVTFSVDNNFNSERFIKCRIRVCHDGANPKGYFMDLSTIENAKDTITNIPILANVIMDEDGNLQFGSHDMTITEDLAHEGEYRVFYEETPIGVVPETCNYQIEQYEGRNYACVDCYIWKAYSNYAQDIVERDKDINLSMEININKYSYDATQNLITISDYGYLALTLLGNNVQTGMANAKASVTGFSLSEESNTKMLTMMQELNNTLTFCNTQKNLEEGGKKSMELENEVTPIVEENAVGVTEGVADNTVIEDLSTLSAEEGNTDTTSIETPSDTVVVEQPTGNSEEVVAEVVEPIVVENDGETVVEDTINVVEPTVEGISTTDKFCISFSLSHDDVRSKLYQSIQSSTEESVCFWIAEVFDDYFIYQNDNDGSFYKQSYLKGETDVALEGNAVQVFAEFITTEEKATLDCLRKQLKDKEDELSLLQNYKEKYEASMAEKFAAEKSEVFSRFEPLLKSIEEFEALKTDETITDIASLENTCFTILGKKSAKFAMSKPVTDKEDKNAIVKFSITSDNSATDEYGGLFNTYGKKEKTL